MEPMLLGFKVSRDVRKRVADIAWDNRTTTSKLMRKWLEEKLAEIDRTAAESKELTAA
jgi:hypothetical protein